MSMKGDLPGLSNFWPGTIGSCQYRTFLPVVGSTSPGFCAPAVGAAVPPGDEPDIFMPCSIPARKRP